MTNPTLDRSRDFGTIHGESEYGAFFEQDGFFFDATGTLIEGAMDSKQREKLEQMQEQEHALEQAREAFLAVMPSASPELVKKLITADNLKVADAGEEDIDLVAWGTNQKNYLFSKVAAKIRREFDQSPVNKKQALEILAEHGLITAAPGASTIPSMT